MRSENYPPSIETFGINLLGLWTLYKRECWRFFKVWNQTVLAPVITSLLFLAVLTLALGGGTRMIHNMHYHQFIAPGLVMMAVVQNAFANTSSSLILMKIQGVIVDILMPPLNSVEITAAMVAGGITRGLLVGIASLVAVYIFVPFSIHSIGFAIFFLIASSMMLALLGMLGGLYANAFDQLAAFTNYIITPLSFLSGTFYSVHDLPSFWMFLSYINPFFYMIDGFRYAMTGANDASPYIGVVVLIATNVVLYRLVLKLINKGWRLKS
jgi:ABC-2 type transport system permease protein